MTDYGNPDVDPAPADHLSGPEATALPDDSDYRGDVRNAIERALAATPKEARTVEAKAEHIHQQLVADSWAIVRPPDGAIMMPVRTADQRVVTVPDGHAVEVVPTTPTYSYADNELDTLAGIVAQLEGLDPESRERVAAFVTHRYGPVTPVPVGRPSWLDITRPPGHDLPLRTGGIIGRAGAEIRISE